MKSGSDASNTVSLFENYWSLRDSLTFHIIWRIALSISAKSEIGDLKGMASNLLVNLGFMDIFTILSLPTLEQEQAQRCVVYFWYIFGLFGFSSGIDF